jgi:hypothetical protein
MNPRRLLTRFVICLFSALASLSAQADDRPDLYLISIGVEPGLTAEGKLDPYARDAQFVGRTFEAAKPLYGNVNQTILGGRNATAEGVKQALADVSGKVRPQDIVIVFFSAHGGTSPETGYGVSLYKTGNRKDPWGGLQGSDLVPAFNGMKGRVVVFVDTCGAAGIIPARGQGSTRVNYVTACEADATSAGSGDSVAYPHGFFVVALVEALRGLGDKNGDGIVTVREVEDYLPSRASSMADQTAVLHRNRLVEDVPLTQPESPMKEPFNLDGKRNPFGLPDIEDPISREVRQFAATARFPGNSDDPNAEAWNDRVVAGKPDVIDGTWQSRWKIGDGEWATGMARIRTVEDRIYILYSDSGSKYLIEARKGNNGRLIGRYSNVNVPGDTTPWVGRMVAPDRIDGVWAGGRWDFRRKLAE